MADLLTRAEIDFRLTIPIAGDANSYERIFQEAERQALLTAKQLGEMMECDHRSHHSLGFGHGGCSICAWLEGKDSSHD